MNSGHYRMTAAVTCDGGATDFRDWMTMANLPMTSMVSPIYVLFY